MAEVRVCIDVADLDRGVRFYTRLLGLSVGRRFGTYSVELLGGGTIIDLLTEPEGSNAVPGTDTKRRYHRHWTPVHLDFVVPDLDEVLKRALEEGATLDREIQEQAWGRMANMADPFGNGFCLLQLSERGYDSLDSSS